VGFGNFSLQVSKPALQSDFLINMPALKTHNQTMLSLGLKNLKGCLSIKSRKFCHSSDNSLDHYVSHFVERLRPGLTVVDGIYGLEKGPFYVGKAVRMDALAASTDPLAADCAGAILAGFDPSDVPHIREYAERSGRSPDPEAFEFRGTAPEELKRKLRWDNTWQDDNSGPRAWDRMGIKGVSIPKYDKTICSICSGLYSPILVMIMSAFRGEPFSGVEILSGKAMEPSGRAEKSLLLGNCMIKANRKHSGIREAVYVKGCPPSPESLMRGMEECGFQVRMEFYEQFRQALVDRYKGKEGFDEGLYYVG
jgi:hypothetical protein